MIETLSRTALASVQDLGRFEAFRWGAGTSGAMDRLALACGNILPGNEDGAAGLEMQVFPFELRFDADTPFALTGADCGATLDGLEGRMLRQGDRLAVAGPAANGPATSLGLVPPRSRPAAGGGRPARRARHPGRRARPLHAALPRALPGRAVEDHAAERPLRLSPRRARPRTAGADGAALARHRAGRHPGSPQRPADRADVRGPALGRLSEGRHRDRGRSLAARSDADRHALPLRADRLGRAPAALDEQRGWLAGGRRLAGLLRTRSPSP